MLEVFLEETGDLFELRLVFRVRIHQRAMCLEAVLSQFALGRIGDLRLGDFRLVKRIGLFEQLKDAQIVKHRVHLLGRIKQLNTLRRLAKFVRHADEHAEKSAVLSLQSVRSSVNLAQPRSINPLTSFLKGTLEAKLAQPVMRTTALLPRSATNN